MYTIFFFKVLVVSPFLYPSMQTMRFILTHSFPPFLNLSFPECDTSFENYSELLFHSADTHYLSQLKLYCKQRFSSILARRKIDPEFLKQFTPNNCTHCSEEKSAQVLIHYKLVLLRMNFITCLLCQFWNKKAIKMPEKLCKTTSTISDKGKLDLFCFVFKTTYLTVFFTSENIGVAHRDQPRNSL